MTKIATLYPNRITVRHNNNTGSARLNWERKLDRRWRQQHENSLKNLEIRKVVTELSLGAKKKIKDTLHLFHHITPSRTVERKHQKYIYNFRLSFITLTLPSPQQHDDTEIKRVALNNFLNNLRVKYGLKNYIWIAEIQKNQNIHFHLVIDIYIPHQAIRYYWNRSINLLGYVDEYTRKFSQMTLQEYAAYRNISVSEATSPFLVGVRSKWKNPGTENVKVVRNMRELAGYLQKYLTKNPLDPNSDQDKETIERMTNFGRLWYRSRSLGKIKFISRYDWDNLLDRLKSLCPALTSFKIIEYEWATIYYVNFRKASKNLLLWLRQKFKELAKTYQYVPSCEIT